MAPGFVGTLALFVSEAVDFIPFDVRGYFERNRRAGDVGIANFYVGALSHEHDLFTLKFFAFRMTGQICQDFLVFLNFMLVSGNFNNCKHG